MKNQYFGDINDYRKYGLLRILSNQGEVRTAVCWMLTESDGNRDGEKTRYLSYPEVYRAFDSGLFEILQASVKDGKRDVAVAETENITPSAIYYRPTISDDATERKKYFGEFHSIAKGTDLVFFDPDNGIEVKSVPYGRKRSSKYLYWHELEQTFQNQHSILLYQHFRRIKRDKFIPQMASELADHLHIPTVVTFRTANVLFLLAPQKRHHDYFLERAAVAGETWGDEIRVNMHQHD